MKIVDIHAAKTHLCRLIEEAAAGEEIIIAIAGEPKAMLAPIRETDYDRKPGRLKHSIKVRDNFDDPLPPDLAHSFGMDE